MYANTAVEAAAHALFGVISVTSGGQTTDYVLNADSVSSDPADHKPFLLTVTGGIASIAFEDMAGQPGCD